MEMQIISTKAKRIVFKMGFVNQSNIWKRAALFLCGALFAIHAYAQTPAGWSLLWSDEFNQADGSAPDSAKWGNDIGGHGWGNSELQYYTARTNNARIESGQLVIEARAESYMGRDYTSARLLTKGKWNAEYGRIEARIKIPRGQGIWPAFWMLGSNIDSVGWPNCGEIDILENIGREPTVVHGTVHGPGYSGANSVGRPYSLPGNAAFADQFHIYSVEWTTNQIKWSVDGQQYFVLTPAGLPTGKAWVFNHPHFVILNLAVGGQWPGNPDATTTFPQRMTVDYVRAYGPTNATSVCSDNGLFNPGFESGSLDGWMPYGNSIGNVSVGHSSNLPVHGGNYVFKVFGQFSGGENYSGVYQDFSAAPGNVYRAESWAMTPVGDQIAGGNSAWMEVSFRDAGGQMLKLYRSALMTSSSAAGVWNALAATNELSLQTFQVIGSANELVAPPQTVSLRYQIVFRQLNNAGGAVLFDDLNLARPDSLDPPVSAAYTESGLRLSFPTSSGLMYEVRCKSDLSAASWQVLTNLTGNGNTRVFTDSATLHQRFYNVARICN